MSVFDFWKQKGHVPLRPQSAPPRLEQLEARWVPYAVSSSAWPNPQLITISFVPDGTDLGGVQSNLFSTFNARFGSAAAWQTQIVKAAQLWAQQTNINFTVVPDNGAPSGSGSYEQGDPGFGDIRIGGYNFGSTVLAQAYLPPPINNYSVGGDIQFNTAQPFNIGCTYDLVTVAAHEIGHALGLYHSTSSTAEMYSNYTGTKQTLSSDDISGIQAIYSQGQPRSLDPYAGQGGNSQGGNNNSQGSNNNSQGCNSGFSTAASLTGLVSSSTLTGLAANLDISSAGQAEYFSVVAPAGGNGLLQVTAQSSGLSLLSPKLTVYAANQSTVLGTSSSGSGWGGTASVTVSNVRPSQVFYIKVQGKDNTALGTGDYALSLDFGNASTPIVVSPITAILKGATISNGGGQAIAINPEFTVSTTGAGGQSDVSPGARTTAVDSQGNLIIVWESQNQDGSGWGIHAQRSSADGSPNGSAFLVNTSTRDDQRYPSVAMDAAGDFVVTWSSHNQDGSGWGVYARLYNAQGVPQGGEFRVNTTTADDQMYSSVAMDAAGDFVITWSSHYQDGSGWGVYAQRYNAQGVPQGGEFQVNTTTADDQMYSSVAMNAAGDFVITWSSHYQDGSGWGVYAQRYNAQGVPQGGEFQVNTTTADDQMYSSVAMDAAGDFIITWSSHNQDGSGWGVYAQRYNAQGVPQGGEFRVNTTTQFDQEYSSVAMDGNGNFVIVWSSHWQGGFGWNVFAQVYAASGAPSGTEFQVNTFGLLGNHQYATVAMDANGDAVIDWNTTGTFFFDGVYARTFFFQVQGTGDQNSDLTGGASDALPAVGQPHPPGCNCPLCRSAAFRAAQSHAALPEPPAPALAPLSVPSPLTLYYRLPAPADVSSGASSDQAFSIVTAAPPLAQPATFLVAQTLVPGGSKQAVLPLSHGSDTVIPSARIPVAVDALPADGGALYERRLVSTGIDFPVAGLRG